MMKITGLSHLFKWENLHNWWLTKYFFAPLYMQLIELYGTLTVLILHVVIHDRDDRNMRHLPLAL